jgi:PhnB protein
MRFMVLLIANAVTESGELPSPELLAQMGAYNEDLARAGVLKDGGGLTPSAAGARVRFSGRDRQVVQGPSAATERTVSGYWIFETSSLEEAIDWVKRCPNPTGETGEIEIRRLHGPEDFAKSDPSGELRRNEATLSARVRAGA